MKRKRPEESSSSKESARPQRDFLNRDELLVFTTQLQLEFNRQFNLKRDNLELYRYACTVNGVETIYKLNLVIEACVQQNIYKSLEEIIKIASINT